MVKKGEKRIREIKESMKKITMEKGKESCKEIEKNYKERRNEKEI